MEYTISQAAMKMNLTPSTLRYYEKEGLLLNIARSRKGVRSFSEKDMDWISIICCLKETGMSIKEIRQYYNLCLLGDESLTKRLEMFIEHKNYILKEIEELKKHLTKIDKKIECYKTDICSIKLKK